MLMWFGAELFKNRSGATRNRAGGRLFKEVNSGIVLQRLNMLGAEVLPESFAINLLLRKIIGSEAPEIKRKNQGIKYRHFVFTTRS